MIKRIISFLEQRELSPMQIFGGVSAIIFLRTFLENFSNPEPTGLFSGLPILLNYFTFYTAVFLLLVIIMYFLSGRYSIKKIMTFAVFGFIIVVTPPIFDLIISRGAGFCMGYIGASGKDLLSTFFTLLFKSPVFCGITPGIKIEAVVVMVGVSAYLYTITKSVPRSLMGAIGAYVAVFLFGAMPGIIATIAGVPSNQVFQFFSDITRNLALDPVDASSIFLGRIQWFVSIILLGFIWKNWSPRSWGSWWSSIRERIPHGMLYIMLAMWGVLLVISSFAQISFVVLTGIIMLAVSIFFAAWTVGIINDLEDVAIDQQSNQGRPLVQGSLIVTEMRLIRDGSLLIALIGAVLVNYNTFVCVVAFIVLYFIHSSGLRLKKHWLSSALIIGMASAVILMAGYFSLDAQQVFADFPLILALFVVSGVAITNPLKDIADVDGDKKDSVRTLPVTIGISRTIAVVGLGIIAWTLVFHQIISWVLTAVIIVGVIIGSILFWKTKKLPSKYWFVAIASSGLFIPLIITRLVVLVFF